MQDLGLNLVELGPACLFKVAGAPTRGRDLHQSEDQSSVVLSQRPAYRTTHLTHTSSYSSLHSFFPPPSHTHTLTYSLLACAFTLQWPSVRCLHRAAVKNEQSGPPLAAN